MNNKLRECMWLQNQFVFTLPACGFVVALNLDWCPDANETIVNGESNQEGQRRFTSESHELARKPTVTKILAA